MFTRGDGTGRDPREVQLEILKAVRRAWNADERPIVIEASVGCHTPDTKVLMFDGTLKCVKDITIGDRLMGPDSTERIVHTLYSGSEEMFRITPVKGEAFIVNKHHILSVYRTRLSTQQGGVYFNYSIKELLEMPQWKVRDLKLFRTGVEFSGNKEPLPVPPYLLGLWLGDGYHKDSVISLTMTPSKASDEWCSWVKDIGDEVVVRKKDRSKAKSFYSKKLDSHHSGVNRRLKSNTVSRFSQLDLSSNNKHIPRPYKTANMAIRLEVLAGLLDSDGHLSLAGYDYISKNKTLAQDVVFLCRSVGLAAYLKECKKICTNNGVQGTYYRVSISGECSRIPCRIKPAPIRRQKKNARVTGFTIEPVGVGQYIGVGVDKDQRYLLGDFTVTHNSGKSYVARAIQLEHGGCIITPQNSLIEQYRDDYPDLNWWWGKDHFRCKSGGFSCSWKINEQKMTPCGGCPFTRNRNLALAGQPTIFNPMSLYYLRKHNPEMKFPVTIVDEAHKVLSMAMNLAGSSFSIEGIANPSRLTKIYNLIPWLRQKLDYAEEMLAEAERRNDARDIAKWDKRAKRILPVLDNLNFDPDNHVAILDEENDKLHIKPVWAPKPILDTIFGSGRLVLMSGTIFKPDIRDMLKHEDYHLIRPENPIPKDNRPIFFKPTSYRMNYQVDRADLAYDIERVIDKYSKGRSTIVHLPYSWAEDVAKGFTRPVITHDKETKAQALELFKQTPGAILLASGMSEGIDLKGDLCRINIIPKILYPNMRDPLVNKKMHQGFKGQEWYKLEALKDFVQKTGRSTRGPDDWSYVIVMDPSFPKLVMQCRKHLPTGFADAIHFGDVKQPVKEKKYGY